MNRRTGAKAAFVLALALALAPCDPASAQDANDNEDRPFDRDCMDDYGRDLCDAGQWQTIVSSFGMEPVDAVHAQGWRGVRVFTIDGYSRDMPMISVLSRGEGPYGSPLESVLEVRGTKSAIDVMTEVLVLRRDAWSSLQGAAERIRELATSSTVRQSGGPPVSSTAPERPVVRPGPDAIDEIVICLHAWVTVTEALSDTGVQRRIRNACGDDLLFDASYGLSAQALRGFPHCNHLNPANYRNESAQLSACLILEGDDRVAAAEVLSIVDGSEPDDLLELSTPDVRWISSSGQVVSGIRAVEAPFSELFANAHFWVANVVGGADGVVVSGSLERYVGDGIREETLVRQLWRRRGDRWTLQELAPESTRRVQLNDD